MAKAPRPDALPNPLTLEVVGQMEEALRELGVARQLIERARRAKIPCDALLADCDAVVDFFQAALGEYGGPQGAIPTR